MRWSYTVDWLKWKVIGGNGWMEKFTKRNNKNKKKRGKVRWKQNLYYLPSLEESSRGTIIRVRFNYLYFVIMHRVKRGFLSRKKKDGVRSQIYIFMNNSFDTQKKKNPKMGKNGVYMQKGPHINAAALIFFSRTPQHYSKMSSRSFDSRIWMKINIEWHNV